MSRPMSAASARQAVAFEVDGVRIAGTASRPDADEGRPLLVALHGGLYTSRYFDVPTWPGGGLIELATAQGHPIATLDRPGYGASSRLEPAENTFERQAELLAGAIAQLAASEGSSGVVLIGHSIGGMIALTVAARDSSAFGLLGVSATGMGSRIPPGGASEGLAAAAVASGQAEVAPPAEQCDPIMFGPPGTWDPAVLEAAHASYAPAPAVELVAASRWAADELPALAPEVRVPVHNALAEHDALWDSSPEAVARFAALFTAAPWVDASVARSVGHSIDHHRLGHALQLRQLAFAEECGMARGGGGS